jgi:hypothetical protein
VQLVYRFILGGLIVSLFAAIGGILKPKSFAGLFSAAPSVALATLGLSIFANGKVYAAQEARSMIAGAIAFFFFTSAVIWLIMRCNLRALSASVSAIAVWFLFAVGIWFLILR